jgi:TRAP-type mannitol/chloroaromatic compound transport system permease large subunit
VTFVMIPPLALIFLVLGTIFLASRRRPKAARWARPAR